ETTHVETSASRAPAQFAVGRVKTNMLRKFAFLGSVLTASVFSGVLLGKPHEAPAQRAVASGSVPMQSQESSLGATLSSVVDNSSGQEPTTPARPAQPKSSARSKAMVRTPNHVAAAQSGSCEPPYTVDSSGIRHAKIQCL